MKLLSIEDLKNVKKGDYLFLLDEWYLTDSVTITNKSEENIGVITLNKPFIDSSNDLSYEYGIATDRDLNVYGCECEEEKTIAALSILE